MIDRPAAPQRPPRRDWFAPVVVAGSLVLHAGLVAPLIWPPRAEAARPPIETPIEVVQMPPEPDKPKLDKPKPDKSKPPAPQAKPPAPPPRQVQAKSPAPKPPAPKPQAAKPQAAKPAEKERVAKAAEAPEKNVAQRMEQLLGPMPAMAVPALGSGDNPLDDSISYRRLVLSRVAKQRREDRHDGIPGHAVIAFTVGDGGEVLTCAVQEKSVDPALDAEAVAMVYRGAPYPAPPPGAERRFTFGLGFHLL